MYNIIGDNGETVSIPDVSESCPMLDLARIASAFGLTGVADILRHDPPPEPFTYDGCSGPAPEKTLDGIDLRLACLLHDIEYWCAYPAAPDARERQAAADYRLGLRILSLGAKAESADLYVTGVRTAGSWWPGAKWGYGR
ncbi:MAG: hypothetical protein GY788_07385 [bacterium]|nr:hypothetical protein [bacterium]